LLRKFLFREVKAIPACLLRIERLYLMISQSYRLPRLRKSNKFALSSAAHLTAGEKQKGSGLFFGSESEPRIENGKC